MKKRWIGVMAGMMVGLGTVGAGPVRGEVAMDGAVLSSYVWRGQVLNDRAVFQPGLTASAGGFSVNAWSSMNLDGTETDGEFTEMDWTVSYSQAVGPVELGAGVVQYTFPNSTIEAEDGTVSAYPGTVEVFVSVGVDMWLAPSLTMYYDVDEIEGFYAVASIGHSFEWTEKVAMDVSASLGFGDKDYNAGYFGHDQAALNDLVLGAALPMAITENIRLIPSVSVMMLPDSSLGDAAKAVYGEKDRVVGGLALSGTF